MKHSGFDSKRSWKVAAACFVIQFMSVGVTETSGMLMVEFMAKYNITRQKASLPYTLLYSVKNAIGPLAAYFSSFIHPEIIILTGCLISSIAIGTCFFAESITAITLLWGFLFGIGYGLENAMLQSILIEHFQTHRAKAVGIVFSGFHVGLIFFCSTLFYMIVTFGLSGTFLVISGLTLNSLPAALVIIFNRPEENVQKQTTKQPELVYTIYNKISNEDQKRSRYNANLMLSSPNAANAPVSKDLQTFKTYELYKSNGSLVSLKGKENGAVTICKSYNEPSLFKDDYIFNKDCAFNSLQKQLTGSITHMENNNDSHYFLKSSVEKLPTKSKHIVTRLFCNPVYILLLVSGAMYTFCFTTFVTILVDFAIDIHVPVHQTKYVLIWYSVTELAGSLFLGWLADCRFITYNTFTGLCFVGKCIAVSLMFLCNSYIFLGLIMVLTQFSIAGISLSYPCIISELLPEDLHAPAIACLFLLSVPLNFTIPPLLGHFRDENNSYSGVFCAIAFAAFLGSLSHMVISNLQQPKTCRWHEFIKYLLKRKKKKKTYILQKTLN